MNRTSLILVVVALSAGTLSSAVAQSPQMCTNRTDIIRHLTSTYHETPVAVGLSDNGSLMEVLASKDGKTWTLLFSLPTGISCLMATGQDWQTFPRLADIGPPA